MGRDSFAGIPTTQEVIGFPGGSGGEEPACNTGDAGSIPVWEGPLEGGMATHCSALAWAVSRTEDLAGYRPRGRRSDLGS